MSKSKETKASIGFQRLRNSVEDELKLFKSVTDTTRVMATLTDLLADAAWEPLLTKFGVSRGQTDNSVSIRVTLTCVDKTTATLNKKVPWVKPAVPKLVEVQTDIIDVNGMTLIELAGSVKSLIDTYGKTAKFVADAGFNSVSFQVHHMQKVTPK